MSLANRIKNIPWGAAHIITPIIASIATFLITLTVALCPNCFWLKSGISVLLLLWIILSLVLSTQSYATCIKNILREKNYIHVYTKLTKKILDYFWDRFCHESKNTDNCLKTFLSAFSSKLYDRAMLIAVLYPLMFFCLSWFIFGQDGTLGTKVLVPNTPFWPVRATLLFMIILFTVIAWKTRKIYRDRIYPVLTLMIYVMVLIIYIPIAIGIVAFFFDIKELTFVLVSILMLLTTVLVRGAGASAGAGAVLVAGAGTAFVLIFFVLTGSGLGASAFVISICCPIFVFYIVFGVEGLLNKFKRPVVGAGEVICMILILAASMVIYGRAFINVSEAFVAVLVAIASAVILNKICIRRIYNFLITLLFPMLWSVIFIFLPLDNTLNEFLGLIIFLGILPFFNAIFDAFSYAITLTLMRLGFVIKKPLLFWFFDMVAALGLFLLLGGVLIFVLSVLNFFQGALVFDLQSIFKGIKETPNDYWWLYAMLFSTALPTTAHGILALFAIQKWLPLFFRLKIVSWIDKRHEGPLLAALAPLALSIIWITPFVVVIGIVYFAWPFVGQGLKLIAWGYFDVLQMFADKLAF